MNDTNKKRNNPLPEKVLRRHAELLKELLPDLNRLVIDEGRPADVLLSHFFRDHKELGSRDRRFLSQTIFSFFRWYGWTVKKLNLSLVEAGLIGAILDCEEKSESLVYLEKKCKMAISTEPLGKKTIPEKCDTLNEWFKKEPTFSPLSLLDLVPEPFSNLVAPNAVKLSIETFQQRPPTWLRLRDSAEPIKKTLSEKNISYCSHARFDSALGMAGGKNLNALLSEHAAKFAVQDIASQCVGLICAPQPGEEWWDCCAGAGGKSLHLNDLMEQTGKVLATDTRHAALKELKKRARKMGIRSIRTQPFNAIHDEPFRKVFDGVLLDAPCSGWGTWARNPDARLRTNQRDVFQCGSRQLKMLNNVAWCVKPGGRLVYAVCSITRPESEEVISLFLDRHASFSLEPFDNPLTGEPTTGMCQLWPYDGPGDGMFIARLKRDADS